MGGGLPLEMFYDVFLFVLFAVLLYGLNVLLLGCRVSPYMLCFAYSCLFVVDIYILCVCSVVVFVLGLL